MKKYLLIKYWMHGTKYGKPEFGSAEFPVTTTDVIEKKHLLDMKQGMCDAIINTIDGTYYDPEKNEWVKIVEK